MLDHAPSALFLLCALGSGLIAGSFFAFSSFVMRALGRLPAREGLAAMQSINIVVINPVFLGVFIGTALLSALAVLAAIIRWHATDSIAIITAAALYILGAFGVTMLANVPLNNRLAALAPDDPEAAAFWSFYLRRCTAWNTARTIASLLATSLFILAL